jgi:predicted neutral ceramidase superfamily lipid hydrolase
LDKDNIKRIYWAMTVVPVLLLNISPYLGITIPESIDSDEVYNKLVLAFSAVFFLFLLGLFGSYKCIVMSEFVPAKVASSLLFFLYLVSIFTMAYFYLNGFLGLKL